MPNESTDEPRFPSNIPVVQPPGATTRPKLEDYEGKYTRISDGEVYALAVVEADPLGRTHKAINTLHFWEGTKSQFEKAFVGEGKSAPDPDAAFKADYAAREKERNKAAKDAK
jgi:hypothetical protein